MLTTAVRDRFLDEVKNYGRNVNGHEDPWKATFRSASAAAFAKRGFPGPREEEWRYTDFLRILSPEFSHAPSVPTPAETPEGLLDTTVALFRNGRRAAEAPEEIGEGVYVGPLAEAPWRDRLLPHLGKQASAEKGGFTALNGAFLRDVAAVYLRAGCEASRPIEIHHLSIAPGGPVATFARTLIVIEKDARAVVIERFAGESPSAYLAVPVTEVLLGPGAELVHYRFSEQAPQGAQISLAAVSQAERSRYRSFGFLSGSLLVRDETTIDLAGEGSSCDLSGISIGRERQQVAALTRIVHSTPAGTSNQRYRAILSGRAAGVFSGKVLVCQDAQKTEAHQASDNLLLSRDAEMNTKPQLEIYADDVKCNHGATVGELDKDAIFYLRSRGVGEQAARSILTVAFANALLDDLPQDGVADYARDLAARLLAEMTEAAA